MKSPAESQALDILNTWISLEVLSPANFDPKDTSGSTKNNWVSLADGDQLPWNSAGTDAGTDFYYVVLGTLRSDIANARISEMLKEKGLLKEGYQEPASRQSAAIGVITLNGAGEIVKTPSHVAVSSYSWALPKLLADQEFSGMDQWPGSEGDIKASLLEQFEALDGDRLTLDDTLAIQAHLIEALRLNELDLENLGLGLFVQRRETEKKKKKDQDDGISIPEPDNICNSYLMADLVRVRDKLAAGGNIGANLSRLLGITPTSRDPLNLLTDIRAAIELSEPAHIHPGRWPSPPQRSLSFLQQVSANLAAKSANGVDGMLAINGPPGTGKTTLLKDIVAQNLVDRAVAMAQFTQPSSAFSRQEKDPERQGVIASTYAVSSSIAGFEMLVASSNNKAVENVTKQLPDIEEISQAYAADLSYFPQTAARLLGIPKDSANDRVWGLISAALGKKKNRETFSSLAWRRKPEAASDEVDLELRGKYGPLQNWFTNIDPASNWDEARNAFLQRHEDMLEELSHLQQFAERQSKLESDHIHIEGNLAVMGEVRDRLHADREEAFLKHADAATSLVSCQHRMDEVDRSIDLSRMLKPRGVLVFLIDRLSPFTTPATREWLDELRQLTLERKAILRDLNAAKKVAAELGTSLAEAESELADIDGYIAEQELESSRIGESHRALLEEMKQAGLHCASDLPRDGIRPDGKGIFPSAFLSSDPTLPSWLDLQCSHLWVSEQLEEKRSQLFVEAIRIHQLFLAMAKRPIIGNLRTAIDVLENKRGISEDVAVAALQTLFLVVPVLSTTFAAVSSMLRLVGQERLGWAIIDEAGQATPQAACGLLWRTRVSAIVGDPIQLKPIVTLPGALVTGIANDSGAAKTHGAQFVSQWFSPFTSLQGCADRTSPYIATFGEAGSDIERTVGVPLLVHRRCQNPMFAAANALAYDNVMVRPGPSLPPSDHPVISAAGPSRWIDVRTKNFAQRKGDDSINKASPDEARAVVRLLYGLSSITTRAISVSVITPFKHVRWSLQDAIPDTLAKKLAQLESDPKAPSENADGKGWIKDHVDTIHSMQGREADVIVLVLGAFHKVHAGARRWAGEEPNLLNVALTRAKTAFYIVGDRTAWSDVPHFSDIVENPSFAPNTEADQRLEGLANSQRDLQEAGRGLF